MAQGKAMAAADAVKLFGKSNIQVRVAKRVTVRDKESGKDKEVVEAKDVALTAAHILAATDFGDRVVVVSAEAGPPPSGARWALPITTTARARKEIGPTTSPTQSPQAMAQSRDLTTRPIFCSPGLRPIAKSSVCLAGLGLYLGCAFLGPNLV